MSQEAYREDAVVLEVVDALARGEEPRGGSSLERETTELWALLPYELEPESPRPEAWEVIRGKLGGSTVVRFPERPAPHRSPAAAARSGARSPWAMAAALLFCLVGLSYLLVRSEQQQTTIAELAAKLDAADARLAEMARTRQQLDMVTRVAQHIYPMHPTLTRPDRRPSRPRRPVSGKVFVCGQHQQWYLTIQGLETPPAGYEYCLWFETEHGKVPAGTMTVRDGVAELSAPHMPVDTKGFAVTLEKADTHPEEPQGDVLLLAEESISL